MIRTRASLRRCFSAFTERLNVAAREPALAKFIGEDAYMRQQDRAQRWVTHDGPPFCSGSPHIGHFFNKTLKDFVNRYQLVQGKQVIFRPGFDCYGIALQDLILQMKGGQGDPMERRIKCRQFVQNSIKSHQESYARWGILAPQDGYYSTMNPLYEAKVMHAFATLLERGMVSRGPRPVYWSIEEQRTLGQDELKNDNELRTACAVKFPITGYTPNSEYLAQNSKLSLLVFSSEPWKLCGARAIAINKNLQYSILKWKNDQHLLVASQRLGEFLVRLGKMQHSLGPHGSTLQGLIVQNPLTGEELKTVHFQKVSPHIGTGAELVCPGHEEEALDIAFDYGISRQGCLSRDGLLQSKDPRLDGKYFAIEGNEAVVEILKDQEALLAAYDYEVKFFRGGKQLNRALLLSLDSWHLNFTPELKQQILRLIDRTEWTELCGKKLIYSVQDELQKMGDWCISEGNVWGIPIPAFRQGSQVLTSPSIVRHVADIVKTEGADAWFKKDVKYLLPETINSKYQGSIDKQYEVFDCWFDSALSWVSLAQLEPPAPRSGRRVRQQEKRVQSEIGGAVDLVSEGYDQHAGWFLNSYLIAAALGQKSPPFARILTHGLLLDEDGKKMSKSLDNSVDPIDLIEGSIKTTGQRKFGFGVEVLRLWAAINAHQLDIPLDHKSLSKLAQRLKSARKILKLALKKEIDADKQPGIIDSIFAETVHFHLGNIKQAYEKHDFPRAIDLSFTLIQEHLFEFYLISKRGYSVPPLFKDLLEALLIGLSPVFSFTAQEAFEKLEGEQGGASSIFEKQWKALELEDFMFKSGIIQTLLILRQKIRFRFKQMQNRGILKNREHRVELIFCYQEIESDQQIILHQLDQELGPFFGIQRVFFQSEQEAEKTAPLRILKKGQLVHMIGQSKLKFRFLLRLSNTPLPRPEKLS